jgi:hypothetical protein
MAPQEYTVAMTRNVTAYSPQHAAELFGEWLSANKHFTVVVVRDDQDILDGVEVETRIWS